jgi:hypothetical protein
VQDPLAEEIEVTAAVHLPFYELEPIDLALSLPVAVLETECCPNRCLIPPQSSGEPFELWQATLAYRAHPMLKLVVLPLLYQFQEGLNQGVRGLCIAACKLQGRKLITVIGIERVLPTHQEPGGLPG